MPVPMYVPSILQGLKKKGAVDTCFVGGGDSLVRNGIGLTLPDTDIPMCNGSEKNLDLNQIRLEKRLQEFDALYEHESSEKMFGLKTAGDMTDEIFREQQMRKLVVKIQEKQQIRVYYMNLLGALTFFILYVGVISIHKRNVFEQSMVLKSFMNTVIMDLPSDTQGFYSSGPGTSGFLSSQQEFIDWLKSSVVTRIFVDENCGDGICSRSEYKGSGRFGCDLDCGAFENQTEIFVKLGSFIKSKPQLQVDKWEISHIKTLGDPAFRYNIFSESMQDYIFEQDRSEDDTVLENVLDGVYYLELYQTQAVSTLFSKEDFFTNSFILAQTVPERVAKTDFAYGDYREFLAVSASIVDAVTKYCFGSDPPITPSGIEDTECLHFFQESFMTRVFSGYGLSGGVYVKTGNTEPVPLVSVPFCSVFPNGSLGLGGLRRFFHGVNIGTEWTENGAEYNIPIFEKARAECVDEIDISGMITLYRSLFTKNLSGYSGVTSSSSRVNFTSAHALQQAHHGGRHVGIRNVRSLMSESGSSGLRIEWDGPVAQDGGPGYAEGYFWISVKIFSSEGIGGNGAEIQFSLQNTTASCGYGALYAGPIMLTSASQASYVRAVLCNGSVEITGALQKLPRIVEGPSVSFTVTVGSNGALTPSPQSLLQNTLVSICSSLGIDAHCDTRVSVTSGLLVGNGLVRVRALCMSNVEAAAWRKNLATNSSYLRATAADFMLNATLAVDALVNIPVPASLLRTIGQPCNTHYDCDGEVTGTVSVNNTSVNEYGWGRAFCALWGSPLTGGVGPTCDHCLLYCTSAEFTSVDGVCPERCGNIPPAGWRPSCLSAEELRKTYQCSSRYRFEVRSHSTVNESVPNPRRTDVPILRSLSGFNNIIGAVVITQKRVRPIECLIDGNEGFAKFARASGVNCTRRNQKDGRAYGIDPTFSRFSTLFNGKHVASEFYGGQPVSSTDSILNLSSQPAEGFVGPDGFIPFGFFPHQWDASNRRQKNQSWILSGAVDEFKLFFDVRIGAKQAGLLLTYIQDGRFIDDSTDVIEIDIVTYNAEVNMLASIRFTFRVEKTGGISWDYSMRSIDATVEAAPSYTFLEALLILFLAVSIIVEVKDILELIYSLRISDYLMSPFNWLDISGFVIQIIAWTKWYAFKSGIANIRLDDPSNFFVLSDPYAKIRPFTSNVKEEYALLKLIDEVTRLADLEVEYSSLVGIIVVLLTFKVIKSLDFQPRMGLITRTLTKAGSNLVHFMALFGLIFFGYGFVGHVMFGTQLAAMATLSNSMRTLGYILLNFDSTQFHSQMRHAVRRDTDSGASFEYEVYIWSYIFVNLFILLNILLAILVAGYTDIASSSYGAQSVWEDLHDFFIYYLKKALLPLERFISDEQLLSHVQKELAALQDKSGQDGLLHIQTVRSTSALDGRSAVLLGGGIAMEKCHLRVLVKSLLDSNQNASDRIEAANPLGLGLNGSQFDESSQKSGSAIGSPFRTPRSSKCARGNRSRLSLSNSIRDAFKLVRSEAVLTVRTNQLVEDLMQRHGDDLRSKSSDVSRDVRNLMELENQARLLRIEDAVSRGLSTLGSRMEGLELQLAAAVAVRETSLSVNGNNGIIKSCSADDHDGAVRRKMRAPRQLLPHDMNGSRERTLHVRILSARSLPRMDIVSACNPYCLLFLTAADGTAGQHQATTVLSGLNPTWKESFDFTVRPMELRLVVALWDKDTFSEDDLVGSVELDLRDLEVGVVIDDWFPLSNPSLDDRLTNSAVHIQALLRSSCNGTNSDNTVANQSKVLETHNIFSTADRDESLFSPAHAEAVFLQVQAETSKMASAGTAHRRSSKDCFSDDSDSKELLPVSPNTEHYVQNAVHLDGQDSKEPPKAHTSQQSIKLETPQASYMEVVNSNQLLSEIQLQPPQIIVAQPRISDSIDTPLVNEDVLTTWA